MLDPDEEEGDLAAYRYFADVLPYLDPGGGGGCADCPPPPFLLPPPPRPPHLSQEACPAATLVPSIDTCDNILIHDGQIGVDETFQTVVIIVVISLLLVIATIFTVACIWRRRKSGHPVCRCGDHNSSTKAESVCYATAAALELKLPTTTPAVVGGEVYDNPNYSHILIGGQPFFILPSGELSDHVPVPAQGERLSPLHHGQPPHHQQQQQHVYLPQGSSTYRSGSDCDTESSTYKSISEQNSTHGQVYPPPIYEEIPDQDRQQRFFHPQSSPNCAASTSRSPRPSLESKCPSDNSNFISAGSRSAAVPSTQGFPVLINGPAVHAVEAAKQPPPQALLPYLSPGRVSQPMRISAGGGGSRLLINNHRSPRSSSSSSSIYYYSDTLRRGGGGDSGLGSSNSSESTPRSRGHKSPRMQEQVETIVMDGRHAGRRVHV